MYRHLLVPLDGSELSTDLVTQAIEFAAALGAKITFFTMCADYGGTQGGALQRTLSPVAYREASAGEANAILAKALAAAGALKLACDGVALIGSHPWELILQVAAEKGCDLIYMASHGRKGLKAIVLGSQTSKVLEHSSLPVLVAMSEGNLISRAGDEAVRIIKDEHRGIAAVVNGLRQIGGHMRAGDSFDLEFVSGLIRYIKKFPETLHHPKEEAFLFARLAMRTDDFRDLINTLEMQHRDSSSVLSDLETLIIRCKEEQPPPLAALADSLDLFADAQWAHLSAEEKLVLPAARRFLTDEDWLHIESAFQQNGAGLASNEEQEALARLFTRLMNLAAEGGKL